LKPNKSFKELDSIAQILLDLDLTPSKSLMHIWHNCRILNNFLANGLPEYQFAFIEAGDMRFPIYRIMKGSIEVVYFLFEGEFMAFWGVRDEITMGRFKHNEIARAYKNIKRQQGRQISLSVDKNPVSQNSISMLGTENRWIEIP